uniref:Uncharacterized protein n=1 Tax=Rhizophora mucronata TaxID=61149 RepID=A0A2P2MRU2_RHIMU
MGGSKGCHTFKLHYPDKSNTCSPQPTHQPGKCERREQGRGSFTRRRV